jgi:high affinity sulfate transporter 1
VKKRIKFASQIHTRNLPKDILSGVIVGLISIPISMGYAQVAGLPAVYGLYGSLLPILVFGLLTTSPQFVVGVDATPAALVGGSLAALGVVSGSAQAEALVPAITLLTALWLFLFAALGAGRVVRYISTPVMGGFISGIGCTIILMQVPKLFGGGAGTGELFQLLLHIGEELEQFNPLSAALGFGTVVVILISKRYLPKFPMPVVMMALGAALTATLHLEQYGVKLLPEVAGGLPTLRLPNLLVLGENAVDLIMLSLSIALVVMAQTLLASNRYAMKYQDTLDVNQEVFAYGAANLAGSLVGCCPINGSVSRTGMADQFSCRSQVMSLAAAGTMLVVLLWGTGLLGYLPVPVLTGIVIAALIGILEIDLAKKLWRTAKNEFFIFLMAFLGVLLFGTIYGVVIGVLLSFGAVALQAVVPPKTFLGMIPGHDDLYNLQRNRNARPIAHTVLYRFGGNLFFANIDTFQEDILQALKPDTTQVIVDARSISRIDVTAAERLVLLNQNLQARGVRLYLTEHGEGLNDQLRTLGAGSLIEEGAVRRTVSLALRDAGVDKPYPLEGVSQMEDYPFVEADERLAEFEWAFGADAERKMEQLAKEIAGNLGTETELNADEMEDAESRNTWGRVGLFDENELLDFLELRLQHLAQQGDADPQRLRELEESIEQRRLTVEEKLKTLNPKAVELLRNRRKQRAEHFRRSDPEAFARWQAHQKGLYQRILAVHPELAHQWQELQESEQMDGADSASQQENDTQNKV